MADINSLPTEILMQIFKYYLHTETQLNFVNCISNVCKKWAEVVKDSSFYETVDGSLPLQLVYYLAKAGALHRTKTFKFSQVNIDSYTHYMTIFSNLPKLKHLDLTNLCHVLDRKEEHVLFDAISKYCPDLCELVASHPDAANHPEAHNQAWIWYTLFEPIIYVQGHNFVKLVFSYWKFVRLDMLFELIANNCPNLEELFVQNLISATRPIFCIQQMQNGCPKLKTLCLGWPIHLKTSSKDAVGFPKLEIFSYYHSTVYYGFTSSSLEKLLFKSTNLKILDFRGCNCVINEVVYSLPAVALQQIYLAQTSIAESTDVTMLFEKWNHSLNSIDMSYSETENINEIFQPSYLPNGLPCLEMLNLSYSSITEDALAIVIQQCPKLQVLYLEGCQNLKQGARNNYHSRLAIEELLLKCDSNEIDCD